MGQVTRLQCETGVGPGNGRKWPIACVNLWTTKLLQGQKPCHFATIWKRVLHVTSEHLLPIEARRPGFLHSARPCHRHPGLHQQPLSNPGSELPSNTSLGLLGHLPIYSFIHPFISDVNIPGSNKNARSWLQISNPQILFQNKKNVSNGILPHTQPSSTIHHPPSTTILILLPPHIHHTLKHPVI